MNSFIVVRPYRDDDRPKCEELIKNYVSQFSSRSFFGCLFKEITVQSIVITWAILFIFLGVPLTFCALSIPGCILFIFVASHVSCFLKAMELINENPKFYWVAESYEPFLLRMDTSEISYNIFENEAPYDEAYRNNFQRKIIGTISVKNHNIIPYAAFFYRIAVHPRYSFSKIAPSMINIVSKFCFENGYRTIELVITEWQEEERDLYFNLGFTTRQIYHKPIIGSNLSITKSQLTVDLLDWFSVKTE